ncbi:hypothetical protein THIX_60915 [Thiomonas sp. X19]|nr:hypothetical protein THIX_60915 [Thiomonas sp. X19]
MGATGATPSPPTGWNGSIPSRPQAITAMDESVKLKLWIAQAHIRVIDEDNHETNYRHHQTLQARRGA